LGDALLDRLFARCFKPAVARTGFDLRRIIDNLCRRIDHSQWG
jgi:hypothetical protein